MQSTRTQVASMRESGATAVDSPAPAPLRLVCFVGAGRSGSTLLGRLLGQLDGFVCVGEATAFAVNRRMRERGIACSCGAQPDACALWSNEAALWRLVERDFSDVSLRMRALPGLLWRESRSSHTARFFELRDALAGMFASLAEHTGSNVVVDTTKPPAAALLLAGLPGIQTYFVHLVRDPRGYLNSTASAKAYLRRKNPLHAALTWSASNLAAEVVVSGHETARRVRYEDLVAAPEAFLQSLGAWIAGKPVQTPFVHGHDVELGPAHLLAGNPDKFDEGRTTVRARELPPSMLNNVALGAVALPLVVRYDYLRGPSARPHDPGTAR